MAIVDPMHNLFQSTAKKMIKLWLNLKVLHADQLKLIQYKIDSVDAASNIGAIPRKNSSSFGGFTAKQWKNWTLVFSIFALKDILPNSDLEIWRHYVLACKSLVSKYISYHDLYLFEKHILKFCVEFEKLYGNEKVTPNMHMHCHLSDCARDYGPVYSSWLFSFERYNGHLGNFPNNNRSIEMQLMRRFMRDAFISSLNLPSVYYNEFSKHLLHGKKNIERKFSDSGVLKFLYLSKQSVSIAEQDWTDINVYSFFEGVMPYTYGERL